MINSMTGYGSETVVLRGTIYQVEIKCLNSKGFDFNFKAPSIFRNLEIELKNRCQTTLERGKVDFYISYKESKKGSLSIDESTFKQHFDFISKLADSVGAKSDIFSIAIDKYSNIADAEDLAEEEQKAIFQTIGNVCDQVLHYRKIEGGKTNQDISNWIDLISENLEKIALIEPNRVELRREKLMNSIHEFTQNTEIDYNRLGQEMIYYIEKYDISEELSRLRQHFVVFKSTANGEDQAGKKLGFIAQELGREINTIGSKANDAEIQHLVVEMKDLLERIKEQLNNVV